MVGLNVIQMQLGSILEWKGVMIRAEALFHDLRWNSPAQLTAAASVSLSKRQHGIFTALASQQDACTVSPTAWSLSLSRDTNV